MTKKKGLLQTLSGFAFSMSNGNGCYFLQYTTARLKGLSLAKFHRDSSVVNPVPFTKYVAKACHFCVLMDIDFDEYIEAAEELLACNNNLKHD